MSTWKLIKNDDSKYAIAISSFRHEHTQTLVFKIGDKLELKEECDGITILYYINVNLI